MASAPAKGSASTKEAIKRVLVVIAMEAEALPVISGLGLKRDSPPSLPPPAPATTFSGRVSSSSSNDKGNSSPSSVEVSVVCSGKCKVHGVDNIGTVPAALMTYLALSELRDPRVDLVISAGTAGGFAARGAAIGDVFCATAFANHDRRIPLAKFDDYGTWRSDAHPAPRMAAALGLKSGPVSTGNSLDWHDLDMASMSSGGAAVKDMEASGVAWACSLHGVPLLALKSVTDIVDGGKPAEEEFLANLATASEALHVALRGALEFVAGKGVDEL